MEDDLQHVAEALGVPTRWLVTFVLFGFFMLLAAAITHDAAFADVAAALGALISLIGVRAAMRPSRPFRLENFTNSPGINTTRRVGMFYVLVGLVWAALALVAAAGS
jgi:hypothetical protein